MGILSVILGTLKGIGNVPKLIIKTYHGSTHVGTREEANIGGMVSVLLGGALVLIVMALVLYFISGFFLIAFYFSFIYYIVKNYVIK